MPPYTSTDRLLKLSFWRMLQAAEYTPLCLQTLVCHVSHMCSVWNCFYLWRAKSAYGKCQSPWMMLGCKHTTFMESGSDNSPSVLSCTKEKVAVLLLGCCSHMAPAMSPGYWLVSWYLLCTLCWQIKQTLLSQLALICHTGGAALPEQHLWVVNTALC